jgi:hypothetical protein
MPLEPLPAETSRLKDSKPIGMCKRYSQRARSIKSHFTFNFHLSCCSPPLPSHPSPIQTTKRLSTAICSPLSLSPHHPTLHLLAPRLHHPRRALLRPPRAALPLLHPLSHQTLTGTSRLLHRHLLGSKQRRRRRSRRSGPGSLESWIAFRC